MKKTFCIMMALLFILALSACNGTGTPAGVNGTPAGIPNISAPSPDTLPEQTTPPDDAPVNCTFNPTLFGGKLQSCAYAGNGTLLVLADKLYLYDPAAASVLAVTDAPLRDFDVQIMDGGYLLSGMGDDGMMAYIYDHSLSLNKEIAVNSLLAGDFVVSETGIAISTDGKKLAVAAMSGLYLYDLENEKLTALLDLTQNAGTANLGIAMLNALAFTQDNSQLVFYGDGISIPADHDYTEDIKSGKPLQIQGFPLHCFSSLFGFVHCLSIVPAKTGYPACICLLTPSHKRHKRHKRGVGGYLL